MVGQGPCHQLGGTVGGGVQPGVDGRGGGPRSVGDEVAGVATPPQGQYGLSHLFHWEHFLKEIIVLKNRDEAKTCVAMSQEILKANGRHQF